MTTLSAKVKDIPVGTFERFSNTYIPFSGYMVGLIGKLVTLKPTSNLDFFTSIAEGATIYWHRSWLEFDYMVSVGSVRESGCQPKPSEKKTKAVNLRRL